MKNLFKYNALVNIILFAFSAILILFTLKTPFYWDNTSQISVPANWYFDTNFNFFISLITLQQVTLLLSECISLFCGSSLGDH